MKTQGQDGGDLLQDLCSCLVWTHHSISPLASVHINSSFPPRGPITKEAEVWPDVFFSVIVVLCLYFWG